MKKSKIILAIALAVAIIVTCISVPTFSWFSRPHSHNKGDKMVLGGDDGTYSMNAYNGYNVSIETKSSTTGVANPDSYTIDCTDSASLSDSGVSIYHRKYFCTTITNSSTSDQNVSLYARKLSIPTDANNGTLALGVNSPTRSYRDYSSLAEPSFTASNNTMRIYFEKDNGVNGWDGTDFYICFNEDPNTNVESLNSTGSNGIYRKLTWVGDAGHLNHYYADIPRTATHAFFAVANWGTQNNGAPDYSRRSQTLRNLPGDGQAWNAPKLYKITNDMDNGNHKVVKYNSPGVGVDKYYSSVSLAAGGNQYNTNSGNTVTILPSNWYIGGSIKYYSSDTSLFTVNENTGVITTNNNGKVGEATLYTKIINSSNGYWDAFQVETTIKIAASGNYEFYDVPIVRNVLIEGHEQNEEPKEVKVYWYVMNNSTTNALSYTIDQVYVGM